MVTLRPEVDVRDQALGVELPDGALGHAQQLPDAGGVEKDRRDGGHRSTTLKCHAGAAQGRNAGSMWAMHTHSSNQHWPS